MRWTTQECKETWSWLQIYFIGLEQQEQKSGNVRQVRIISKESLKVRWLPSNFHEREKKWNYWRGVHTGGIIPQVIGSPQKGKLFSWFKFTNFVRCKMICRWRILKLSLLYIYREKRDTTFWNDTSVTFCANSLVPSTRSKTAVIDILAGNQQRGGDLYKSLGELCT